MASHTDGIQQLIAAEKKAADKIAEARKRKAKRMKEAKDEAQSEVDKYREEREGTFNEYTAQHLGNKQDIANRIAEETALQLQQMESNVENNKEAVLGELLGTISAIKPAVHRNLQKD